MEPPKVDTEPGKDGIAAPKVDVAAGKDGIAAPKVDAAAGKDYIDTQFRSFFLKQINELKISILIGLALYIIFILFLFLIFKHSDNFFKIFVRQEGLLL